MREFIQKAIQRTITPELDNDYQIHSIYFNIFFVLYIYYFFCVNIKYTFPIFLWLFCFSDNSAFIFLFWTNFNAIALTSFSNSHSNFQNDWHLFYLFGCIVMINDLHFVCILIVHVIVIEFLRISCFFWIWVRKTSQNNIHKIDHSI